MKRLVAAAFGIACLVSVPVHAKDLRLGYIAAMSGPLGVIGAEQKRGLDIALKHLGNKIGGLKVDLVTADTKANPGVAVQEAAKLVEKDKVSIITGGTASNSIMAMVKPIVSAGVFFIGSNGGPSPLAGKQCQANYFNVSFQNDQWSEGMGAYMRRKGLKNPYFIGMDYQAGWDHVAGARRGYGKSRPIAGQKFTPRRQLDFSAELAEIRAAHPDGVFAFYAGGPAVAFVKQYAQFGLKKTIPLYSNVGLSDPLLFKAQGDAALGLLVSGHYNTELDYGSNKIFVADFRKAYGRDPSTFAAQQYDAIMLLNAAIGSLHGKIDDKNALRTALRKANFKSVRGPFRFNNNHMPIQNIYIQRVSKRENGRLYLKKIDVVKNVQDPYHSQCPMK